MAIIAETISAASMLLTAPITAAPAAAPKKVQSVMVNGHRYKVQTKGRRTFVAYKAALVVMRPETPSEMRQAVREATGCEIVDWVVHGATMTGVLECPTP